MVKGSAPNMDSSIHENDTPKKPSRANILLSLGLKDSSSIPTISSMPMVVLNPSIDSPWYRPISMDGTISTASVTSARPSILPNTR